MAYYLDAIKRVNALLVNKYFYLLSPVTRWIITNFQRSNLIYNGPQNLDKRLSSPYNKVGGKIRSIRNKYSMRRAFDNIFTERLWRSPKYEEVYIKDYSDVKEVKEGIGSYFKFYNNERPHQSLGDKTPYEVYYGL